MKPLREADLEQLYARLEKPIYNVVYRWVWQSEEAQEIVQEAFVRLWRMRERVDPSTAQPLVYKIALNLAASALRRRKVWRWLPMESLRDAISGHPSAAEAYEESEERTRVRAAVMALPDDMRRVVLLCEYSELSYDEIAAVLSISRGTVGSRRHRALKLLRATLEAGPDENERAIQPV